uniref:Uncharacterized protein n=1 Tax=Strongyloides stercoralis TaxID=6248 RepID=A0A0K0ESN8_STRER
MFFTSNIFRNKLTFTFFYYFMIFKKNKNKKISIYLIQPCK